MKCINPYSMGVPWLLGILDTSVQSSTHLYSTTINNNAPLQAL